MEGTGFINGKEVALTEEENTNANKFHRNRLAFGILEKNGKQIAVYNVDEREHYKWLKEDYGVDKDTFETMVRGYIMKNKIQFYTGSNFKEIDIERVDRKVFAEFLVRAKEVFGSTQIKVFNGVNVGKVGEVWTPKYEVDPSIVGRVKN